MIKRTSTKRALEMGEYLWKSKRFLACHPRCERCGGRPVELHHERGRIHSLLNDERFWHALCKVCHEWVHRNINKARDAGLIAKPGEWNKVERRNE